MPGRSWADFHALMIARYGPLPDEDADMPYRDPEIYHDMRFHDAMLPYVPQDLGMTVGNMIDDIMEDKIIAHMMQANAFVDDYQVPVDDAGIGEPLFQAGTDDLDPANFMATPEDQPEDPLVIIIDSDDDEEDIEE
ncbi:hypothetical protein TIFTF001_053969 [Ficus carica]|uniref:Uncharacterized protein n=1 Tax=Ficus carica TaxID=3494 RepID=A0AA88EHV1_FICCA|nr:hypothetical protein TIFTF001_053969 [Ficus carica]